MNKAELDMRLKGFFKNNQEQNQEAAHDHAGQENADSDVHLSEVIQPATLIIGILVLVLVVLIGWFILVLKPALNDNESMIHFMPPVPASNEVAKPIAIAPNETLVQSETLVPAPVPQSIAQPVPLSSENPAENHSNNTVTNVPSANAPSANASSTSVPLTNAPVKSESAKTTPIAKTKSGSKSHHAHANRNRMQHKKANQHLPTLNEEQKCTSAQIAMQQCATYP